MMTDPVKYAPIFQDIGPHLQHPVPPPTKENFLSRGVAVHNVLTANECKALVELTEKKGYQDAAQYCQMYRDRWNDRFMSDDPELASFVWERVKEFIPRTIITGSRQWEVDELNTRFRFCKYQGGCGHYFGPHTDGMYVLDNDHRSLLTCMLYLNGTDDFDGGLTNFIEYKTSKLKYSVVPETGLCVIFPQVDLDFYHEGTRVTRGLKYILRTDVMYHAV